MAELYVNGVYRALVHRKVWSSGEVEPPNPKRWLNATTNTWYVLRHGDRFYCDDCPTDKRQVEARLREYCPPGERRFP